MSISEAEENLYKQIQIKRLPIPRRWFKFHPDRKWEFDFAWPSVKLAVEVDGGNFSGGRHTRGKGFEQDCEKINSAILLGWRVLRFTPKSMTWTNWEAVEVIGKALEIIPTPKIIQAAMREEGELF